MEVMAIILRSSSGSHIGARVDLRVDLPALSTHLRVLREAGLVNERRAGQNRFYSVNREKMSEMRLFFEGFWDDALLNLKRHAESKAAKREE